MNKRKEKLEAIISVMNTKIQLRIKDILGPNGLISGDAAHALICHFKKATAIELDFSGVDEMGDDFAREIFIVWREKNPKSTITVIKACEGVENVIWRVMKAKS